MYTAIVLDKQSRQLLTWAAYALVPDWEDLGLKFKTQHDEPLPHHMTINLGALDQSLNFRKMLHRPAEMQATALYIGTDVLVFKVIQPRWFLEEEIDEKLKWVAIKTMHDEKSSPHVTCALTAGNKPMISNQLFNGTTEPLEVVHLDEALHLSGIVKECGG